MAGPRQRTKAQRKPRSGSESENEDVSSAQVLDEQSQDKEIIRLRAKNASSNAQAQNALDIGIVTSFFIAGIQLYEQLNSANPTLAILSLMQAALLPLSLTPYWLSSIIPPSALPEDIHLYLLSIHLAISGCGIFLRLQEDGLASGSIEGGVAFNEIARWALPSLTVFGVEMQRKAERTAEEKINLLEGLKYDLKGA